MDLPEYQYGLDSAVTLDIPYARKVLEHLQAHPEEHEQNWWGTREFSTGKCKTTACIAGTAVLMDAQTTIHWNVTGDMTIADVAGKGRMPIDMRAAELLGVRGADTYTLFHNTSNQGALNLLADYIAKAEEAQAQHS